MQTKTQATEGKDPQQTTGESSLDDATCSSILIQFESRDSLLEMLCHRQFGAFPVYDDDPEIGLSDDAKKAVSWLFSQQALFGVWQPMESAPKDRVILVYWGMVTTGAMGYDIVKHLWGTKWKSVMCSNRYPSDAFPLQGWVDLPSLPNAKTDPLHGRGKTQPEKQDDKS